ncbi:hypothetical protein EV361DRAFT_863793 [Lentinula raphanica]|nr:hypothetical protein EV361DRAFT_863793 [Lentinula raphanica]
MSSPDVYEDLNSHVPTQQGLISGLRPVVGRSDTDNLLSYYQSPLADSHYQDTEGRSRTLTGPSRQLSVASSDSDYSDSSHSDYTGAAAQKRLNIPSEGGSDRRRVAIVEMDTLVETAKKKSIRSRRGKDGFGSLALVAPPDASPNSYSQFTPPLSAPVEGKHGLDLPIHEDVRTHQRSQSEINSPSKKSPRNVGIVGTAVQPIVLELETVSEKGQALQPPPLFIHPQSRSPSPGAALASPTSLLPMVKRRSTGQSILVVTPEIGAAKPIDAPVASPVVVALDSQDVLQTTSPEESPSMSQSVPQAAIQPELHFPQVPTSYLNYKPGIHATAGPLPPPPRAAFTIDTQTPPPPRPPRLNTPVSPQTGHTPFSNSRFANMSPRRGDLDVMRQALQLPPSVAKALAARPASTKPPLNPSPKSVDDPSSSSHSSTSHDILDGTKSSHRREGAFSPSSEDTSPESVTINVSESDAGKAETVIPPSLRRVDQHISPIHEDFAGNEPPITEHPLKPPSSLAAYSSISAGSSSSSFGTLQPAGLGMYANESQTGGPRVNPIQEDTWVDVQTVESSPSTSPRASVEHPRLSAEHSHHSRTITSHTTSQSLSVDGHTSVSRSPSSSPHMPRSHSPSILSQSDSRSSTHSPAPSPPPKSFRHSITTGLKRMSLPRSPSGKSLSRGSHERERSSTEENDSSHHPLPDIPQAQLLNFQPPVPLRNIQSIQNYQKVTRPFITPLQPIKHKRKIDPSPAAMFCSEVTSRRNASERCMLYAQKINELYMYDCGLGDWMEQMRGRGSGSTHRGAAISLIEATPTSPVSTNFHSISPSTIPFTSQPRQISGSSHTSVITEATFPRRPDASAATDLSVTFKDALSMSPPSGPPPLPYPSLVSTNQKLRSNTSVGSTSGSESPAKGYKSLIPGSTSKTGAFFASLGRKASVSRKDKGLGSSGLGQPSSSSPARLTKQPQKHTSQNSHPPVVVTTGPPSVPGGPRAPPNRMLRSQTIMVSPMPSDSSSSSSTGRTNVMARRPSLYNIPSADSVHHSVPSSNGHTGKLNVKGGPRAQSSSPSKPPTRALYGSSTPPEISWDPEFRRQVDKLSDLLPHADRAVLAGYLRRSGQDILAIGQYLEDEKTGRLRRD